MSERSEHYDKNIKVSGYKITAIDFMNCEKHSINILDHKIKHKPTFFSNPTNIKHYFQAIDVEN